MGFITAVVTARVLGPAGKGTLSTLLLVGVLLSYVCTMGIGDAATVLIARGRFTLQDAYAGSVGPVALASLLGVGCLWVLVPLADWTRIIPAIVAASVLLPVATFGRLLTYLINTRERIGFTSLVSVVMATTTTTALVVSLVFLDHGLTGALAASLLGAALGLVMLLRSVRGMGVSLRPAISKAFAKEAIRFGWHVELSYVMVALTQRVDLLIVYALLGESPAGRYSLALTLSQLASYGPFALIMASFPRLAQLGRDEFLPLVTQLWRMSLLSGVLGAVLLAVTIPLIVRPLFGSSFTGAASPALLLLPAAVLGSQQWLLARAAVSIGRTLLYPVSFALSLGTLVGLDYLLVPAWGLSGAAIAAVSSSGLGLAVCLFTFRSWFNELRIADLVPRLKDFTLLRDVIRGIVRRTPVA